MAKGKKLGCGLTNFSAEKKLVFFFLMATLHFTSIVKKEIINDYFTSQRSNSQHNKTSFIPFQNTQLGFN